MYEDQGDWSDSEESKEISLHLPVTDNESNDCEKLPKKRKRTFYTQFFIIKSYRKGLLLEQNLMEFNLIDKLFRI